MVVTVVSLILATYAWAKYTTSKGPLNAQAQVAKWNVSFNESDSTIYGTNTHVTANRIAPGTSGSFSVTAVPGNTEVCFNYEIMINSFDFILTDTDGKNESIVSGNIAENVTVAQLKNHIKFYYLSGGEKVYMTPGTTKIVDTYDIGDHNASGTATTLVPKTIYWEWPYEDGTDATYDAVDTAAGEYANSQAALTTPRILKLKINYSMSATQIEPNTNSHVTPTVVDVPNP